MAPLARRPHLGNNARVQRGQHGPVDASEDPIVAYYDALAPNYDADRFASSYGRYIDRQEQRLLKAWLPAGYGPVLDLCCGTGRLSHFATHGCDASPASIAIARARHPAKTFDLADLACLPYPDATFAALFCFHVGMHLGAAKIEALFFEAARVLRPGGLFLFDIASAVRRRLVRRAEGGWHGSTSLSKSDLAVIGARAGLALTGTHGIAMAPVHRLPGFMRTLVLPLDNLSCAAAPQLASYLVARFGKQARA